MKMYRLDVAHQVEALIGGVEARNLFWLGFIGVSCNGLMWADGSFLGCVFMHLLLFVF